MQFKRRRELKRTRIEIIPMIDTIFFLLVFFMLSSLALTRLNGLPVDLPKTRTAPSQKPTEITISIDKTRQIFVNREGVSQANLPTLLRQKLKSENADFATATLIINADQSVPHGLVVSCIDQARAVGVAHFAIATQQINAPQVNAP